MDTLKLNRINKERHVENSGEIIHSREFLERQEQTQPKQRAGMTFVGKENGRMAGLRTVTSYGFCFFCGKKREQFTC